MAGVTSVLGLVETLVKSAGLENQHAPIPAHPVIAVVRSASTVCDQVFLELD